MGKRLIIDNSEPYRSRRLITLSLISVCCILLFAIATLFNKPRDLYYYNSEDVQAVCDLFDLSKEDDFCDDPSKQGPGSLERMLELYYPVDQADYWGLYPNLVSLRMEPVACFTDEDERKLDDCPPPTDCTSHASSNYTCEIIFPGDIGLVKISFSKSTEWIARYRVERPSGS